jgi:hypothetical protein
MRRGFGKPSIPALIYFGALIVALIVGLIVGGGTGDTIVAILALTVLGTMGIGKAEGDAIDRRGRGGF